MKLFLPLFLSFGNNRKLHYIFYRFRSEIFLSKRSDKSMAFRTDDIHDLACCLAKRLNEYIGCFFKLLLRCLKLLRPKIHQSRNLTVGKTEKMLHLTYEDFTLWRLPQNMQSDVNLAVLQILNIGMKLSQIFLKVHAFLIGDGLVHFSLLGKLPDFILKLCRLTVLTAFEMCILVHELFKLGDFIKGPGIRRRRRKITNKAGSRTALCDYALARNRHKVRIDIRQLTHGDIRVACFVKTYSLARKPLHIAVGTEMNNSIRFEHISQPVIKCQILMCRRNRRIMVYALRVHAILARRLHSKENIAVHGSRNKNIAFIREHYASRSFSPLLRHFFLCFLRKRVEIRNIFLSREFLTLLSLSVSHKAQIICRMRRHELYKLLCARRNKIQRIPFLLHTLEKKPRALHGVKSRRTSDVVILRRIVMKNKRNLLVLILHSVEMRPLSSLFYHSADTFRYRTVIDCAVRHDIFCRNRNSVNNTIQLRKRSAYGGFHRTHALAVFPPAFLRC